MLVQPQVIATAAAGVADLGSAISEANAAAAGHTTGVLAAASDEVSAATATLVSAYAVLAGLVTGTQQGISAAVRDLGHISASDVSHVMTTYPSQALGDLSRVIFSRSPIDQLVTATGKIQPTIDIATALMTALPSYDASLFMDGISQMANGAPVQGLVNAIGMPIAADVGLATLLTGYEALVLTGAWYPPPTAL